MNVEPDRPRPLENRPRRDHAITIIEALVVLVVTGLLGMFLLGSLARPRTPSGRIFCVNQLKQIGIAFRLFATDNGDRFPQRLSTNDGGTLEFGTDIAAHFRVLSNELAVPKLLVCPLDSRLSATNFATLTAANISYFLGMEADELLPGMVLSGDGNLTTNFRPARPGWLYPATNVTVGWTSNRHGPGGNLGLSDASVQLLTPVHLGQLLKVVPNLTNRFLVP